jgi:hypothetical protein
VNRAELVEYRDAILDVALSAAAAASERGVLASPLERGVGTLVSPLERGVLASPHEVEEGMGPRLKSFAVVRAGVASRISDALRIRPHSFNWRKVARPGIGTISPVMSKGGASNRRVFTNCPLR